MTEKEIVAWAFGIIAAILGGLIVAFVKGYIHLYKEVTQIKVILSMMGEATARALHSPSDHLGLDKYIDHYLFHEYELPLKEWDEFRAKLMEIANDKTRDSNTRFLADSMAIFCEHKLMLPARKDKTKYD